MIPFQSGRCELYRTMEIVAASKTTINHSNIILSSSSVLDSIRRNKCRGPNVVVSLIQFPLAHEKKLWRFRCQIKTSCISKWKLSNLNLNKFLPIILSPLLYGPHHLLAFRARKKKTFQLFIQLRLVGRQCRTEHLIR